MLQLVHLILSLHQTTLLHIAYVLLSLGLVYFMECENNGIIYLIVLKCFKVNKFLKSGFCDELLR
jgi:hypothetical protein